MRTSSKTGPEGSGASSSGQPGDLVDMLHDLYAVYPDEDHAALARALLQVRKKASAPLTMDAVEREVGGILQLDRATAMHRSRS